MKRIREKNINTEDTFNAVFSDKFNTYNSYKNICYYNNILKLGLFNDDSYLDFGCGGGQPLNDIKNKYPKINVVGVDISSFVISENKKKFPDCEFIEVKDFICSNKKHDNILSSHTFEHLEDPMREAKNLLLKSIKSLTIIVPYKKSWQDCEQHLWSFDKSSFQSLRPDSVLVGLTNNAGNTELIFHWNKDKKIKIPKIGFEIYKIIKQSPIGFMRKLKRIFFSK